MRDLPGLGTDESTAYRLMVERPSCSTHELALLMAVEQSHAAMLLSGLESRGLVARSAVPGRFVASPPDLALGAMVMERQEELRGLQLELGRLSQAYRGSPGRDLADVIDVVSGRDAVAQRFRQLHGAAREEVLAFVRAGVVAVSAEDNREEDDAVARGVGYRVVVERSLLDRPGFLAEAEASLAAGEEVRLARELPLRMLVVDRRLALVPMAAAEGPAAEGAAVPGARADDAGVGALLVHRSSLLDALVTLFEEVWRGARSLSMTPDGPSEIDHGALDPLDSKVLQLLLSGLTDRGVATQLGLSLRTVQRRVRELMNQAGVESRLQLGLEVGRRGWV
ncbi:LuxR C-terminal-related transcriptional regulator [Luteimicrobium sp. DT211]|uniref:LuxR C-terminal-related transcriptional regulator n=1 Tax=Luteimicrobium sp. DT211 TaxID=3393412 RepID=UPI003CED33E2